MEARELRIGNFVYDENQEIKIIHSVSWVFDAAWVHFKGEFNKPETFNIEPVHLTDDWLFNFGFLSNKRMFSIENMCLVKVDEKYQYWFSDTHCCELEYVHQLQNLYFAFTGKEITENRESWKM